MHPGRRELQAILSAPFSTVTHHPQKELVTNMPGVQVFYPSSEAFPLPQCRLLVVSQGLKQEAETQSCSRGYSCQGSSAWGTHIAKPQQLSCLLLSSCPLMSASTRRWLQGRSVFLKREGLGTGLLLPVNTHLFNGCRWE